MRGQEGDLSRRELLIRGAVTIGGAIALSNRRAIGGSGLSAEGNAGASQPRQNLRDILAPVNPLKMRTAAEIEAVLPPELNVTFDYPPNDKKRKEPSFALVGPLVVNRVVSSYPGETNIDGEAAVGQKYLELKLPGDENGPKFWLSFSGYMPDDLASLNTLKYTNPPDTQFRVVFPINPPDGWRRDAQRVYRNVRGLNRREAAELDEQVLRSGLGGYDGGWYWTTFNTDYLVPMPAAA